MDVVIAVISSYATNGELVETERRFGSIEALSVLCVRGLRYIPEGEENPKKENSFYFYTKKETYS